METRKFAEYKLSSLMLGTVQFGMNYGVANRTGQPTYDQILEIMQTAIDHGINCLDTAAAYGTSEEILGRALRELNACDKFTVVTKVKPLNEQEKSDAETATRAIESSVSESRRRLGLNCLPLVLFHRQADASYLDVMESLKERGWLRHAGVSCDNDPAEAGNFIADNRIDALQIPANILDHRHRHLGIFKAAAERGKAVFVRSVFLQGLIVMPEDSIPIKLQPVIPYREKLQNLAKRHGLRLTELAIRYILSLPGVTSVIAGVETVSQLQENLNLIKAGKLPGEILEEVENIVPDLPEYLITPSQWT